MNTLLLINAIVFGAIGAAFTLWGSNIQSRLVGLVQLLLALANVGVLTKIVAL